MSAHSMVQEVLVLTHSVSHLIMSAFFGAFSPFWRFDSCGLLVSGRTSSLKQHGDPGVFDLLAPGMTLPDSAENRTTLFRPRPGPDGAIPFGGGGGGAFLTRVGGGGGGGAFLQVQGAAASPVSLEAAWGSPTGWP